MTPALCLYRVRDLTFLPHLLEIGKPSRQITVAELAQKFLQTTDSNTEEWLNQSIERLDNETHYDQQRQLLQRHLKGTAETPRAPSEPKPSDARLHKPPKGSHEVRSATPNRAVSDTKAYPLPSTPQRTSGAPPIGGQPPTHNIHNCSSEPLALGAAPIGAYPNAVATQPASTPELAGGAPPIGGQPPAAHTHTPTHTPNTPQSASNSARNSSPISLTSCLTFAVTTRANNHPVSDTSPLGMLEDGRNLGALETTNSKRSRPAYAEDLLSCKRPTGHTSRRPGSIRSFLAFTSSPLPPHLRIHTQAVGLRSSCQSGTRSSHTKPYYQDKSWLHKCNSKAPKSGSSQYTYTQTMSRKTYKSSSSTSTRSTSATGPSWQETSTGPMSNAVSYGTN